MVDAVAHTVASSAHKYNPNVRTHSDLTATTHGTDGNIEIVLVDSSGCLPFDFGRMCPTRFTVLRGWDTIQGQTCWGGW
jgi:hypothetical protein